MLILGFLIIPGALTEHWFEKDYWIPETFTGLKYSLFENGLFAFLVGGIGAVIYEEFANRSLFNRHLNKPHSLLLLFPIIPILFFVTLTDGFGLNSMYSFYLGLLTIAVIMLTLRPDLIRAALVSAVLLTIIFVPLYFLFSNLFPGIGSRWWVAKTLSSVTVFGYPIEELGWYPVWGLTAGPLYEFIRGFGDRKLPRYSRQRARRRR